jgi:alkyldihydroxyacetonephosphate synthase
MGMTVLDQLTAALGADKVLTDESSLQERRHDYWFLSALNDFQGRPAPKPLCVVRPISVDDVIATVNTCREAGLALITFGLGSGVCGGVIATPESVLLDMSSMDRVREIDPINMLASFEAGHNGAAAEKAVAAKGMTIGNFPQSIAMSSVGGWIATRASGQFSSVYGNIEDIVYSIEAVMPDGSVVNFGKAPRASAGPDLRHLLLGSEGTMGVITGVTFSLRRQAEKRLSQSFYAPDMITGLEAQRQIVQQGWAVPVMRLYDEVESVRHAGDHHRDGCAVLMLVHEGPAARVDLEVVEVRRIALEVGLEEAPAAITEGWLEHRNDVPSWDELLSKGYVVDTIEISAPWTQIGDVYNDAVAALKAIPHNLIGSAHSSHVYRSGINLYFTFVAQPTDKAEMAATYLASWKAVLDATAAKGGGVAHHHGIGRVRKNHLSEDLGDTGIAVLRAVKSALDPAGIMNPGVLLPDV